MMLYIGAIVAANWLVTRYGQAALPWTAFCLIPFDLIIRDLFQDRWQNLSGLRWRMGLLILAGAIVSLATMTGSLRVNLASLVAFTVAGVCDALTYQRMIRYGRIFRINGATILAAVTDSIVFAFIAFDHASWRLAALQSATKIAGGFVWSLLMYRFFRTQGQLAWDREIMEHPTRPLIVFDEAATVDDKLWDQIERVVQSRSPINRSEFYGDDIDPPRLRGPIIGCDLARPGSDRSGITFWPPLEISITPPVAHLFPFPTLAEAVTLLESAGQEAAAAGHGEWIACFSHAQSWLINGKIMCCEERHNYV